MVLDNVDYLGEHSVIFTKDGVSVNTWSDWGLVPSSRHSRPINSIWSQKTAIAGVNGDEDLVRPFPYKAVNSYELLKNAIQNDNPSKIKQQYGYDILQPSSGSLSFIIADQTKSFFKKQQEITNFLHNQKVSMKFTDDNSVTYTVRTTVDFSSSSTYSGVSISYSVIS